MMTRTYANKNIRAVLKQEMKNCNITKTFPRADIWARCQLFKATVNGSAVTVQYGGSYAKTDCIREGEILATLGGHKMKNEIFRVTPKVALEGEIHVHFGEMVENGQPQFSIRKWSLPQRQTPYLFTSNSQEHWYANGETMAHIFYSLPVPNFL